MFKYLIGLSFSLILALPAIGSTYETYEGYAQDGTCGEVQNNVPYNNGPFGNVNEPAGFCFLDANFDKCYNLVRNTYTSSKAVDTCMELSREFQFIQNPNFDRCFNLRNKTLTSAYSVKRCIKDITESR